MDFDTRISEQSVYGGAIGELAKDPMILSFYHEGRLPGKATVKLYTSLDKDSTYGFYYFNSEEQQGEYCGEVLQEEGFISFELNNCSDYFIAPYNGKAVLTSSAENRGLMIAAIVFELLLVLAAAGAVLYRRFGKEGLHQKFRELPGRLPLKKKNVGNPEMNPEEEAAAAEILSDDSDDGESDELLLPEEDSAALAPEIEPEDIGNDEKTAPVVDYASFSRPVREHDDE